MTIEHKIMKAIREVKDFPKPGINFKDITPVLKDSGLCEEIVREFVTRLANTPVDAIVCTESRGFFFGFLLAHRMRVPLIPLRKKGKLPWKTISRDYDLEYGKATVEMHADALKEKWNVLVHDDLLATGGTAKAAAELVEMQDAKVSGFAFLVELGFLEGRKKLPEHSENIISLVRY